MTNALIGIVAAYMIIAVLLLSMNLTSRWRWWIKAGAIVVTTVFFVQSYISTAGLLGWPTPDRLPNDFQLHWTRIVEPDEFSNTPGAIYMWVEELDANNVPLGVPRSFELPYTRQLAESVQEAQDNLEQGREQAGSVEEFEEAEQQEGEEGQDQQLQLEEADRAGEMAGGAYANELTLNPPTQIEFTDLPAPLLPPKPML